MSTRDDISEPRATLLGLLLAGIMGFGGSASAAGLYLSEIGTPGSLGTAGVANPTNTFSADSSWTNPAGMTGLDSEEMLAGIQAVLPSNEFESTVAEAGGDDGGNAGQTAGIPSFFYVKKLTDRTRLGFSVTAPLGGGYDFGDRFVGRYAVTKVGLAGVFVSPSLAYQVTDDLSLGAGVSAIYTIFEQDIAINLGPAPDGKVKIDDATDWSFQPFLGLTYQLSERALLGIVYRGEAGTTLDGDVEIRGLPLALPTVTQVNIAWDYPQLLEVGLRYRLSEMTYLFANADWEDWSAFSNNKLAFQGGALNPVVTLDRNFDDTWHLGIGMIRRMGVHGFSLGASYDSSPVDDADRTIDLPFDEQWKVSASFFRDEGEKLDYAVGATFIYLGNSKVDQTAQGVRFAGKFDTNYLLMLGGTLRYRF